MRRDMLKSMFTRSWGLMHMHIGCLLIMSLLTNFDRYLQRCLVKNLEALHVHYDSTVRDDTDGSIVQVIWLSGGRTDDTLCTLCYPQVVRGIFGTLLRCKSKAYLRKSCLSAPAGWHPPAFAGKLLDSSLQ